MTKTFTMELAGRTLRVDVGRVAAQANGAYYSTKVTLYFEIQADALYFCFTSLGNFNLSG